MNAVMALPNKVSIRPASNVSLSYDKHLSRSLSCEVSYTFLREQRGYHLSQIF